MRREEDDFAARRARAEARLAAAVAVRPAALEQVHAVRLRPAPALPPRKSRPWVQAPSLSGIGGRGPGRPRKTPPPEGT